jgi:RND family efflux transporter MFP subunit
MVNESGSGRRVGRKALLLLAVVGGVFALVMWFAHTRHADEAAVTPSVAVTGVLRTNLTRVAEFDAEFRPYQEIDVHAKVTGFVKTMNVDIGDQVKEGQLLATLEMPELDDDLRRAEAVRQRSEDQVRESKAASEDAHLTWSRMASVQKTQPNLIAQQDMDNAHAKDEGSAAAMSKAQHDVLVAKADVEKLKTLLAYTQITAPFDGVITKREADPGALIAGGTSSSQTMPLLRLSENNRLRLTLPVSVSYVGGIRVGQPVQIHVQSTGQVLTQSVSRFSHKVDTATRTMDVEVDVLNPDLTLVPGMYASATLEVDRHDNTLAVPVAAVARKESATVLVVTPQNKIQERTVHIGLETPTLIEITSGLQEGERVMIGSRGHLQPGQLVAPKLIVEDNTP